MTEVAVPIPVTSSRRKRRGPGTVLLWVILLLAGVYLVLPLIATLLFSVATVWSRTILPQGYTLRWFQESIADDRFRPTVFRSLKVAIAAALISPLLVTPALLYVHLKSPRWKPWLEFLSIVPWALPGVVIALAMIRAYIGPYNVNRPMLLVLTYVLLSIPFMFRAIDTALTSIDVRTMVDAAQMLGAGWPATFRRVILPNIMPGVLAGALLVAALATGEFALASLMVGSGWKTFPIYQAQAQGVDGRIASALAVLGLAFTFAISMCLILLGSRLRRGGASEFGPMANK